MPLRIRIRSAIARTSVATPSEPGGSPRLGFSQLPDSEPITSPPAASLGLGSRALRNTVIVLTAKAVARLIALITVLYLINYFLPERYGSFTVLVNLTAIVSVVLDLGFNVL